MGLPWVRLDSTIMTHDKTALLLSKGRAGFEAFALYVGSLAYAGGHATDGYIARHALPVVCPPLRAPEKLARLLVDVGLWKYAEGGWQIPNYLERQQSAATTEKIQSAYRQRGRKGACRRHHGPNCRCWETDGLRVIDGTGHV